MPKTLHIVISAVLLSLFISNCRSNRTSPLNQKKVVELRDFETFIGTKDHLIAAPTVINYDENTSSLFVYDAGRNSVLQLTNEGKIQRTYGRPGRGPGEFIRVNNLIVTTSYLFIVDTIQYVIHKYEKNGTFVSTFNYGRFMGLGDPQIPLTPFSSSPQVQDRANKPFVTPQENVLLSTVGRKASVQSLYQRVSWQGTQLSKVGDIPEGATFQLNYDKLRSDISKREVPSLYKAHAFPVVNRANPETLYIVYTAFPRIVQYNKTGKKQWSVDIGHVSEIDSITRNFYTEMQRLQKTDYRNRITLHYYTDGISSPEGELHLATSSNNPVWIHHFDNQGNFLRRFKLIADDQANLPIFTIDFSQYRFFVVTKTETLGVIQLKYKTVNFSSFSRFKIML